MEIRGLTLFMSFSNSSSWSLCIFLSFSFSRSWIFCATLRSSINFLVLFCCFSLSLLSLMPRLLRLLSFITSRLVSTEILAWRAPISFISQLCLAASCFVCADWAFMQSFRNCFRRSSRWERTSARSSRLWRSASCDHCAVCSETARRTIGSLDSSALLSFPKYSD